MNIINQLESKLGFTAFIILKTGEKIPVGIDSVDRNKNQVICLTKNALQLVHDKKRTLKETKADKDSYLTFNITDVQSVEDYF